jgi:pimeloyl-ACP methyl ester carboxylesterase
VWPVPRAQAQAALGHSVYVRDCRSWPLVVVGHSLGAGVAALLALRLRAHYPTHNVTCVGACSCCAITSVGVVAELRRCLDSAVAAG